MHTPPVDGAGSSDGARQARPYGPRGTGREGTGSGWNISAPQTRPPGSQHLRVRVRGSLKCPAGTPSPPLAGSVLGMDPVVSWPFV